ncbi:MAG: hypothetical protein SFX72_18985 [Isosphaeraceae bacterium]|nr:hypothetical protein [Isosphaeraceae bacterium]
MSRISFAVALCAGLTAFGGWARAQSPSGPEPGAAVPALKVVVGAGERAGEAADLAKERAEKPTVYLFVRADKWDRPMARYLRVLDQKLAQGVAGAEEAQVVITWLTDDVDKAKNYLPLAQQSLKFERSTLSVFPGARTGPDGWMINDAAYLTSVVAKKGKVVERFGFVNVGESDVEAALAALAK